MSASKGEQQFNVAEALQEWNGDTILWGQWRFPAVDLDGDRLPEALPMTRTIAG